MARWSRSALIVLWVCLLPALGPGRALAADEPALDPVIIDQQTGLEGWLSEIRALLGLSDEQRRAVDDLFVAAIRRQAELGVEARREWRLLRRAEEDRLDEEGFIADRGVYARLTQTQRTRSIANERRFAEDVKALLWPEQMQRWPAVERAMRRRELLPVGSLSGEYLNLFHVVALARLDPSAEPIARVLEMYATELDDALVRRERVLEQVRPESEALAEVDPFAGTESMRAVALRQIEIQTRVRRAGLELRSINDRYAVKIVDTIGPDARERFLGAFHKARYPQVFGFDPASQALEAALALADLSADERAALESLKQQHQRGLADINPRLMRAIDLAERDGGGEDGLNALRKMAQIPAAGDSALRAVRRERRLLERRTMDQIRAIIGEERAEFMD